jgi:amidase
LVDNLENANIIRVYSSSSEDTAMSAEFKKYINAYLKELVSSPVRSLTDLIAFNKKNSKLVSIMNSCSLDLCNVLHSHIRLT